MIKNMKKGILVILGTISLGLGLLGMLLPILPTTPFLLLSSFCYLRSSARLHHWLVTRRVIGDYIYNYLRYKAVVKSTKIFSIILLWATLIISMVLVNLWPVRILLFVIGVGVTIHLLMLKTISKSDMNKEDSAEMKAQYLKKLQDKQSSNR